VHRSISPPLRPFLVVTSVIVSAVAIGALQTPTQALAVTTPFTVEGSAGVQLAADFCRSADVIVTDTYKATAIVANEPDIVQSTWSLQVKGTEPYVGTAPTPYGGSVEKADPMDFPTGTVTLTVKLQGQVGFPKKYTAAYDCQQSQPARQLTVHVKADCLPNEPGSAMVDVRIDNPAPKSATGHVEVYVDRPGSAGASFDEVSDASSITVPAGSGADLFLVLPGDARKNVQPLQTGDIITSEFVVDDHEVAEASAVFHACTTPSPAAQPAPAATVPGLPSTGIEKQGS